MKSALIKHHEKKLEKAREDVVGWIKSPPIMGDETGRFKREYISTFRKKVFFHEKVINWLHKLP